MEKESRINRKARWDLMEYAAFVFAPDLFQRLEQERKRGEQLTMLLKLWEYNSKVNHLFSPSNGTSENHNPTTDDPEITIEFLSGIGVDVEELKDPTIKRQERKKFAAQATIALYHHFHQPQNRK